MADHDSRVAAPVSYLESRVGELAVDGDLENLVIEQMAARIAKNLMLVWDTDRDTWEP